VIADPQERERYAREQRDNCRPLECCGGLDCWADLGGVERLVNHKVTAPRCLGCDGRVRMDEWRTPAGMELQPKLNRGRRRTSRSSRPAVAE
jgi:hypothetical protein